MAPRAPGGGCGGGSGVNDHGPAAAAAAAVSSLFSDPLRHVGGGGPAFRPRKADVKVMAGAGEGAEAEAVRCWRSNPAVAAWLGAEGRTPVVWQEAFDAAGGEGLPADAIVQVWDTPAADSLADLALDLGLDLTALDLDSEELHEAKELLHAEAVAQV
ncbi:hypothetical protein GPECTOR_83g275 [Gonium pectorale]|uniref:Uncharacterized protein n=1 Tax=Gonium pectorale TaxID=33097 RepID=A0A150G1B9_GONPE|nr:hypothetical protein GPECTOR_83g275 [Gonium pectorale]|eukprot:KXZ43663.1 hypothetical protein GPECTOR_83g275 [Gonium pectorale]